MSDSQKPVSSHRRCSKCQQVLPVERFRRRYKGRDDRREPECGDCRRVRRQGQNLAKREKLVHRFAAKMKDAVDDGKVFALCHEMFRRFDGVDGFAQAWYGAYEAAMKRHPGSSVVTNSLLALVRLGEACAATRPEPDLSLVSDADLERMHEEALRGVLGVGRE